VPAASRPVRLSLRPDNVSMKVRPLAPAPGQEPFGSWANIKVIMRHDPLFGALLVLMALNVVGGLVGQSWFRAGIGGLMLWGILTFRWWGYWLAMLLAVVGLVGLVVIMAAAGIAGLVLLIPVAINAFVITVLYRRRDCFD